MANAEMKKVALAAAFVFAALSLLANGQPVSADPIVDVAESQLFADGKYVGVNVPLFFKMALDTRPNKDGFKLSQSVLSGFVTTDLDLRRQATGRLRGPVKVRVGGITVYDNKAVPNSD